jgi:hypothetical protein
LPHWILLTRTNIKVLLASGTFEKLILSHSATA